MPTNEETWQAALDEEVGEYNHEFSQLIFNGAVVAMPVTAFKTNEADRNAVYFNTTIVEGVGSGALQLFTPGTIIPLYPVRPCPVEGKMKSSSGNKNGIVKALPFCDRVAIIYNGELVKPPSIDTGGFWGNITDETVMNISNNTIDLIRNQKETHKTMYGCTEGLDYRKTEEHQEFVDKIFTEFFPTIKREEYIVYITGDALVFGALGKRLCFKPELESEIDGKPWGNVDDVVYIGKKTIKTKIDNERLDCEHFALLRPLFHSSNKIFLDPTIFEAAFFTQHVRVEEASIINFKNNLKNVDLVADKNDLFVLKPDKGTLSRLASILLSSYNIPCDIIMKPGIAALYIRLELFRQFLMGGEDIDALTKEDGVTASIMIRSEHGVISPAHLRGYRSDKLPEEEGAAGISMYQNPFGVTERACTLASFKKISEGYETDDVDVTKMKVLRANVGINLLTSLDIFNGVGSATTIQEFTKDGAKKKMGKDSTTSIKMVLGGCTLPTKDTPSVVYPVAVNLYADPAMIKSEIVEAAKYMVIGNEYIETESKRARITQDRREGVDTRRECALCKTTYYDCLEKRGCVCFLVVRAYAVHKKIPETALGPDSLKMLDEKMWGDRAEYTGKRVTKSCSFVANVRVVEPKSTYGIYGGLRIKNEQEPNAFGRKSKPSTDSATGDTTTTTETDDYYKGPTMYVDEVRVSILNKVPTVMVDMMSVDISKPTISSAEGVVGLGKELKKKLNGAIGEQEYIRDIIKRPGGGGQMVTNNKPMNHAKFSANTLLKNVLPITLPVTENRVVMPLNSNNPNEGVHIMASPYFKESVETIGADEDDKMEINGVDGFSFDEEEEMTVSTVNIGDKRKGGTLSGKGQKIAKKVELNSLSAETVENITIAFFKAHLTQDDPINLSSVGNNNYRCFLKAHTKMPQMRGPLFEEFAKNINNLIHNEITGGLLGCAVEKLIEAYGSYWKRAFSAAAEKLVIDEERLDDVAVNQLSEINKVVERHLSISVDPKSARSNEQRRAEKNILGILARHLMVANKAASIDTDPTTDLVYTQLMGGEDRPRAHKLVVSIPMIIPRITGVDENSEQPYHEYKTTKTVTSLPDHRVNISYFTPVCGKIKMIAQAWEEADKKAFVKSVSGQGGIEEEQLENEGGEMGLFAPNSMVVDSNMYVSYPLTITKPGSLSTSRGGRGMGSQGESSNRIRQAMITNGVALKRIGDTDYKPVASQKIVKEILEYIELFDNKTSSDFNPALTQCFLYEVEALVTRVQEIRKFIIAELCKKFKVRESSMMGSDHKPIFADPLHAQYGGIGQGRQTNNIIKHIIRSVCARRGDLAVVLHHTMAASEAYSFRCTLISGSRNADYLRDSSAAVVATGAILRVAMGKDPKRESRKVAIAPFNITYMDGGIEDTDPNHLTMNTMGDVTTHAMSQMILPVSLVSYTSKHNTSRYFTKFTTNGYFQTKSIWNTCARASSCGLENEHLAIKRPMVRIFNLQKSIKAFAVFVTENGTLEIGEALQAGTYSAQEIAKYYLCKLNGEDETSGPGEKLTLDNESITDLIIEAFHPDEVGNEMYRNRFMETVGVNVIPLMTTHECNTPEDYDYQTDEDDEDDMEMVTAIMDGN